MFRIDEIKLYWKLKLSENWMCIKWEEQERQEKCENCLKRSHMCGKILIEFHSIDVKRWGHNQDDRLDGMVMEYFYSRHTWPRTIHSELCLTLFKSCGEIGMGD